MPSLLRMDSKALVSKAGGAKPWSWREGICLRAIGSVPLGNFAGRGCRRTRRLFPADFEALRRHAKAAGAARFAFSGRPSPSLCNGPMVHN